MRRSAGRRGVLLGLAVAMTTAAGSAVAAPYAPVDAPGPALSVPRAALDASLRCPEITGASSDVVLLIPGTTVDPGEAFDWNYRKVLTAQGIPACDVTLPEHTNGDIQVAAEYVVDAVRRIHARSGRRVVLLGWSQGASTLPRWAIRFWPDIRPMISSLVGLAPLNNIGSAVATGACAIGRCVPAAWQQRRDSAFMDALNSGQQTFPEIAYTAIFTRTDEVVTPNVDGALSVLPAGPNVTNVAVQDVCPTDVSEHLAIIASPGAYAVAIDAIRHPGAPADLRRAAPPAVCLPALMPGVAGNEFLTEEARIASNVGPRLLTGQVEAEPALRCYVTASCPPAPTAVAAPPRACTARPALALRARPGRRIVRAVVRVGARRAQVVRGRDLQRVRVRRPARGTVTVRITTRDDRGRTRTTTRRLAACR